MSGWNLRLVSSFIILNLIQPVQAADEGIDPELLEFLGEWETDAGEWIDPEQLEDEGDNEEKEHEKTTE